MRNKMQFIGLRTPRITTADTLENVVQQALLANNEKLDEGDILVITSKIVSICEKNVITLAEISTAETSREKRYGAYAPNPAIDTLIDQEADFRFPGEMFLTIKDGIFIPSAGIDTSNTEQGTAVLWPKDSQKSANELLASLKKSTKIEKLGILIVDSYIQPLRDGVTSFCLACNGFEGVEDARGQKDLYGNPLKVTKRAIADSLAAGASVLMGESDESIPIVLIREAAVTFTDRQMHPSELKRNPKDCLFEKLYPEDLKNKA